MKLQYRTHNCMCGEPCPRSGREAGNKPLPYRELEEKLEKAREEVQGLLYYKQGCPSCAVLVAQIQRIHAALDGRETIPPEKEPQ